MRPAWPRQADGDAAVRIAQIATANRLAIAYGYAEGETAAVFNSVQLIGPAGARLANYRKTHLFGPAERAVFRPGAGFAAPIEVGGFMISMLICYDIEYPESVRALALMGADLVLVPTALGQGFANVPDLIVPARAVENRVFVAYCNHAGVENGLEFPGLSRLAGPDGAIIAAAGAGEALIVGDIGAPGPRAGYPYLEDRRPELYGLICAAAR